MQKWDIPPDRNQHELIPSDFWNIPVSVKTAKYGSPIPEFLGCSWAEGGDS